MIKFLISQKKKISIKKFGIRSFIFFFLAGACSHKNDNADEIKTVDQALALLQNQDSVEFYRLVDTSYIIELKGKEGLSNELRNAAYFLKKFGQPKSSEYKVIKYESSDSKSAQIIAPLLLPDTLNIKNLEIVFEFVKYMPRTKAANFYVDIRSVPKTPITPLPPNN